MPRCDFCGKKVSLPFHCQYCGKNFCTDHRLPPDHACPGLAAWKKNPAPGVGIRYGSGGASAYGGGYPTASQDKQPRRRPARYIPYLKIAVAVIVLILVIFLLLVLIWHSAPGANATSQNVSSSLSPVPTSATAAPALPVTTSATPSVMTVASTFTSTISHSITPTVTEESTEVATATSPFPLVPGNLYDDPYPISTLSLANRIHDLVNGQRQQNGLAVLSSDPSLTTLALNHSTDMAEHNYFSHTDLSGEDPTARGNASGYTCIKNYGSYYTYGIAENIFQNNLYTSVTYSNGDYSYAWSTQEAIAQSTVIGWMNSEGHRKNILTPSFNSEGIGVAIASDDKVYITEDFC
jgi:uncharacterized protein YkwD